MLHRVYSPNGGVRWEDRGGGAQISQSQCQRYNPGGHPGKATMRLPFRQAFRRALRLQCPNCGQGRMFVRWLRMYPDCSRCGLSFFRESGYYVGGKTNLSRLHGITRAILSTDSQSLLTIFRSMSPLEARWRATRGLSKLFVKQVSPCLVFSVATTL